MQELYLYSDYLITYNATFRTEHMLLFSQRINDIFIMFNDTLTKG